MPVFSYFSDLIRQQQRQDIVWSIAVIQSTVLFFFRFLGACRNSHVELTFVDDCMCKDEHGVRVSFAAKIRMFVDEIGLAWFFQGSLFDIVCLFMKVKRWIEVDWSDLAPLDT